MKDHQGPNSRKHSILMLKCAEKLSKDLKWNEVGGEAGSNEAAPRWK